MGGLRTQTTVLALGLTLLLAVHGLKFENNAYTDLLIAIHSDVPEDSTIIDQLKQMVEDASPYLYHATQRKAYLGQVTILVPSTWTAGSYSSSSDSSLTFTEADVRVDVPHPQKNAAPYVFQPEQCGQPGRYIHLTPGFLTDIPGSWGNKGRVFVHEFAHLRYGVFDEYGDGDLYPFFYTNDANQWVPTRCSKEVKGTIVKMKNSTTLCKPGDDFNNDCFFLIDTTTTAVSSIMYAQHVESIVSFCERRSRKKRHDGLADNKHNAMCKQGGRGPSLSTWEVIEKHPDLSATTSLPGNKPPAHPPKVDVVKKGDGSRCGRRIVLLLDTSDSMIDGTERWFRQNQAADKLLSDIVPLGSEVGIVIFNTYVEVKQDLTLLEDDGGRAEMTKNLPTDYDFWGYTAIGNALHKAKEMLTEEGKSGKGSRILLITDGVLTRGRTIAEVVPEIQAAGITVHTIAYGKDADGSLASLSQITGGMYSYSSEGKAASSLDSAVTRLLEDLSLCDQSTLVSADYKTVQLTAGKAFTDTVKISSELGKNTMFLFTYPREMNLDVELTSPSGDTGNQVHLPVKYNIKRIGVMGLAETGSWSFRLEGVSAGDVTVEVVSESRTNDPPMTTEMWVGDTTLVGNQQYIYVYVHKGYAPVINADVGALVELPNGTTVTLKTKDNGRAPDVTKDDGVYTVGFPVQLAGQGRYSLNSVVNTDNASVVKAGSGTGALPAIPVPRVVTVLEKMESVTRVTSGGGFDVTSATAVDPNVDSTPPSPVTDLEVKQPDPSSRVVTLTWTSPGDDLSLGQAASYDLRMASRRIDLVDHFDTATRVTEAMLASGSLKPLPADEHHAIRVRVPPTWTHPIIAFAIQATDEANNTAPLSNLAVAPLQKPTFQAVVEAADPDEEEEPGTVSPGLSTRGQVSRTSPPPAKTSDVTTAMPGDKPKLTSSGRNTKTSDVTTPLPGDKPQLTSTGRNTKTSDVTTPLPGDKPQLTSSGRNTKTSDVTTPLPGDKPQLTSSGGDTKTSDVTTKLPGDRVELTSGQNDAPEEASTQNLPLIIGSTAAAAVVLVAVLAVVVLKVLPAHKPMTSTPAATGGEREAGGSAGGGGEKTVMLDMSAMDTACNTNGVSTSDAGLLQA